jgi:hypothetical protein
MAKSPYKHPSVFIGCSYTPEASYRTFKEALELVPIEFHFADSSIRSFHVLERIRSGIVRTDYSLFDITGWNANVTLEVGLAEGLNKDYYILFRRGNGAKANPPSDLQGVQRFQYRKLDGFNDDCLTYQLNHHLVKKLTHPRFIYDQLAGPNREKEFIVAMRLLAHFKRHERLRRADLPALAKGSYLRDNTLQMLIDLLRSRRLIVGRTDGQQWSLGKKIYKNIPLWLSTYIAIIEKTQTCAR